MTVDEFLSRLEKVKKTGSRSWLARCPAHADRSPSLSVRDAGGGVVLFHCFAGCTPDEVCGAIGVELSDLFPPRPEADSVRPRVASIPAADVLAALEAEVDWIYIIAGDIERGKPWPPEARWRYELAMSRVKEGLREARRYA